MSFYAKDLNQWAIRKIETEAPEDVDLLVGHFHCNVPEDGNEIAFNYFLTDTEKGFRIAKTFIIDNNGYDFWAMPWERLEHIATLEESITTSLIDGTVLWARNEESVRRFDSLRKLALDRLQDVGYRYQISRLKLDEAMDIYKVMMFDDNLSHARKGLSSTADLLAIAVGLLNGIYFTRGPEEQDKILDTLNFTPEGFTDAYRNIPYTKNVSECCALAYDMISKTGKLLAECAPLTGIPSPSFVPEELTGWFEESIHEFHRLYYYTTHGDAAKTLQWGYSLQSEIDYGTKTFGLPRLDFLDSYDPDDLMKLNRRAREVQTSLRESVLNLGVRLREYDSLESFLNSGE